MAEKGTWITVAVIAMLALGQSDTGNESQLGHAGTKITNGAASIAEKASSAVSNPGLPSQSLPDVSAAPTGAPSTTDYDTLYAYCVATYTGMDWVHPRKSAGECKTWAKARS